MRQFTILLMTAFWSVLLWFPLSPPVEAGMREKALLEAVQLPAGFKIDLYSDAVAGARTMAMSPSGVLFVGTRQLGRVYAVVDKNADFIADQVITIADGLNLPNGVAYWNGDLYVSEVGRILCFRQVEMQLRKPQTPEVIYQGFPKDLRHGWKFIRFGPDRRLYVSVGAPCNSCVSSNPVFASITRLNPDGSGFEVFAHGVRSSAGFDWRPRTGAMWFTDNGREGLGPDLPPDELNRADMPGLHFGFPYCYGGITADPELGGNQACERYTPPMITLGPHVAAMGMRFYTGTMFPEAYRDQIFIAEHGSWDRAKKIGYRISLVRLKSDRAVAYEPFAQGWLTGPISWGRPVDVEMMVDGSLLVSDDQNGAIYRISYQAP